MPQHRVTFVFGPNIAPGTTSAPPVGTTGSLFSWTESWYRAVNETDTACFAWAEFLKTARRAVLTAGWQIRAIRLSIFPNSRTSSRRYYSAADGYGLYNVPSFGGTGGADEQPYDTLVHACASASGHSRQFGMRGIGFDVVSAGGSYQAPGIYTSELLAFQRMLTGDPAAYAAGGACIRITTPSPKVSVFNVYTAFAVGVPAAWTATPQSPVLQIDPGPAVQPLGTNVIRISGVLGLAGLNGQWTVRAIQLGVGGAPNYIQLMPKRGRSVLGAYVGGGYLQIQNYSLDPIISITPSQGGSRRTGGSSIRPRGRRSRRAS